MRYGVGLVIMAAFVFVGGWSLVFWQINLELDEPVESTEVSVKPISVESTLRIVSWNVASHENDSPTLARQLGKLGQRANCQIVALQQVAPADLAMFGKALPGFAAINGKSGGSSRLQILYDPGRIEQIRLPESGSFEGVRVGDVKGETPLRALFRDKASGVAFWLINVHLASANAAIRNKQAAELREWARSATLPIVAIGNFDFNHDFHQGNGGSGLDSLLLDSPWKRVLPESRADRGRAADGIGVLTGEAGLLTEFALVGNSARQWQSSAAFISGDGAFPEIEITAAHLPVSVKLLPK
jgi:hypothetical protein